MAKPPIVYTKPEGDDWKPDTQLWHTLYDKALQGSALHVGIHPIEETTRGINT